MKRLKKDKILIITVLLIVTVAIIWIATALNRNKTKAFLARYEITNLIALGFQDVIGINDKGQVLGSDGQNLCIWDEQKGFKILNIPKATDCSLKTFNNSGQIAGSFNTSDGEHAFIWDANSGSVDLGTLGGKNSWVWAMNDSGQVIGLSEDPNAQLHPFFWDPGVGMVDLYGITNDSNHISIALDISSDGTVIGVNSALCGIVWNKNKGFWTLPHAKGCQVFFCSLSPSGRIAAILGKTLKQSHLVVWARPNSSRDLGTMGKNIQPLLCSINDTSQIVGLAVHRGILDNHWFNFFFSDETGFIVLEEPPNSRGKLVLPQIPWLSGSTSNDTTILDINNRGQILKVTSSTDGKEQPLLMTPKKTSKK